MTATKNSLKVVTWNANSIKSKIPEFSNFITQNDYDIAGICETKLDKSSNLNFSGFKTYCCNRNSRGGGVAIIVKNNIKHSVLKFNLSSKIEAVGIKTITNSTQLIICQTLKQ